MPKVRLFRRVGHSPQPPGPATPEHDTLRLDFPESIQREFPREFPAAWAATQRVLGSIRGVDLSVLARNSPGLQGFDWENYLRVSVIRMVHAQRALNDAGITSGRVLDLGAYFGNFSLMFAANGYTVSAADTYAAYGAALQPVVRMLRQQGVAIVESAEVGRNLEHIPAGSFDVVACMGVVEHVPHTPRDLLEAINRVLKPNGHLLLDTPNLAYIYNRQRLARGESVFPSIQTQYFTEVPFEGHHREYTGAEVRWMLATLGHEVVSASSFNYSLYGLDHLSGLDLENHRRMQADPELREILLFLSRKRPTMPRGR